MQDFRHQYTPPVISEDNMIAEYDGNDDEYLGQPQAVPAGHALQWLSDAWLLFKQQPGMWILAYLVFFGLSMLLSFIPLIGGLLQNFLVMVLQAGFMYACEQVRTEGRFELGDIFAGFKNNFGNLAFAGILYLVGTIVIVMVAMLLFGGGAALTERASLEANSPVFVILQLIFVPIILTLFVLLMATFYLAPALIILQDEPVFNALKLSRKGFTRNIWGALLATLIMAALSIAAAIPLFLGFLILGPIMMIMCYAVYRDLFFAEA